MDYLFPLKYHTILISSFSQVDTKFLESVFKKRFALSAYT